MFDSISSLFGTGNDNPGAGGLVVIGYNGRPVIPIIVVMLMEHSIAIHIASGMPITIASKMDEPGCRKMIKK